MELMGCSMFDDMAFCLIFKIKQYTMALPNPIYLTQICF